MLDDDRREMIRNVRHRLEALRRAGLDRIPEPPELEFEPLPASTAATLAPAVGVPLPSAPPTAPTPPLRVPIAPSPTRPAVAPVAGIASLFGDRGLEGPNLPREERERQLEELRAEVAACTRCPVLVRNRTQTVFGVGDPMARLMFIGEAPGSDEDRQGVPFIGRAGQLLTDMITKGMGLKREDVYIANILKSRPPDNRDPEPSEVANCIGYLERQIALIRPEFLCLLGRIAAQNLLETALPMGRLRGKWYQYRGVSTLVTYHPAYLLRNPAAKKDAWEDLKMLMRAMGLKLPEAKKPRE